jgi:hypothetical protein
VAYGVQVYQNYQHNQSGWDAWTNVDGKKIAIGATVGAVAGGVGFAAGPMLAGIASKGLLGSVAAGGIEGAMVGAASQLVQNLLNGCDWDQDLLQSVLIGAATGGIGGGLRNTVGKPLAITAWGKIRSVVSQAINKITPQWMIDQAIARLEAQVARYGANGPIDKAVRLRLLRDEIDYNPASIKAAIQEELEKLQAIHGILTPHHVDQQLEDVTANNFNLYQFLDDWGLRIW